jgi:hypothetical protein
MGRDFFVPARTVIGVKLPISSKERVIRTTYSALMW